MVASSDLGRIVVAGLSKAFGRVRAVDELSFTVEPGTVTGFLGLNGAGKTTTLRMLLGLVPPDAGEASVGGRRYVNLPAPPDQVGAALEATGFHPARTGRNHLRVYCTVGGFPLCRADEVLDLVGLADAGRRPVGGYSLGMRQRLALAAAAATRVRQGPLAELFEHAEVVSVRTPAAEALLAALSSAAGDGARVQRVGPEAIRVTGLPAARVGDLAFSAGVRVHELTPRRTGLEDVFFALTADHDDRPAPALEER